MKTQANKQKRARLNRPAAGKRPALRRSFGDGERIARINRWYDGWMFSPEVDRVKEFANYGYWDETTRNGVEACENLMEKLLAFLPKKEGTILDVACGKGATTRHLLKYFKPENVTGINISEKQLARCRENAPGCTFLLMSATDLKFPDNSFDNIICVEAASHFVTREKFLKEAFRVLRPGGRIVLSDVLATRRKEESGLFRSAGNYVPSVDDYRALLSRTGFCTVEVVDATLPTWIRFYRQAMIAIAKRLRKGTIPWQRYARRVRHLNHKLRWLRYYVLASAQKPAGSSPGAVNLN